MSVTTEDLKKALRISHSEDGSYVVSLLVDGKAVRD